MVLIQNNSVNAWLREEKKRGMVTPVWKGLFKDREITVVNRLHDTLQISIVRCVSAVIPRKLF